MKTPLPAERTARFLAEKLNLTPSEVLNGLARIDEELIALIKERDLMEELKSLSAKRTPGVKSKEKTPNKADFSVLTEAS